MMHSNSTIAAVVVVVMAVIGVVIISQVLAPYQTPPTFSETAFAAGDLTAVGGADTPAERDALCNNAASGGGAGSFFTGVAKDSSGTVTAGTTKPSVYCESYTPFTGFIQVVRLLPLAIIGAIIAGGVYMFRMRQSSA